MNFPTNRHPKPLSELAKKYNISPRSASKLAKEMGFAKTREEYETTAQLRRKIVFDLRQQGKKFREIGEMLGITENNAKQLARRFEGK